MVSVGRCIFYGLLIMSLKLWTIGFTFTRWLALVALALLPTALIVVTYRWYRGRPLWTMADLPVAVEVTTCVAWIAMLMATHGLLMQYASIEYSSDTLAVIASIICAVPLALAYDEIERLNRVLGPQPDGKQPTLIS